MQVMYKRCCGIDVHKMKIVCCLKKGNKQEIREFSAETKELIKIAKWLKENKCEMIAMESTGSFWKPLWNVFEDEDLNQMLCNAKDMKNVPGKKTDIKDSEWICDLLQHGLLKASYIPDREQISEVSQSCPTLCDPSDCSLPGSSVHGIFQARVLEWVAISFSRGSSQCRDRTPVSRIAGRCLTRKPQAFFFIVSLLSVTVSCLTDTMD